MATTPITDDQKKANNIQSIDEQLYYFELWFYNQIEGQVPFQVPFSVIDSISIEETLSDWNTKGWLILNNDYEVFEKYYPETTRAPLIFRTDGRNRMRIQIYPIFDTSQNFLQAESTEYDEIRKKWEICVDAVIYDVEDIDVPNAANKKRKLYFHTEVYQIFSEKNIDWSTAVEGYKEEHGRVPPIGVPDADRVCRAAFALKSLIKVGAKDTNGETIKIGWENSGSSGGNTGSIDKPTTPIATGDPWMEGWMGTNNKGANSIFYTAPPQSNVIDDMNHVLKYCGTIYKGPAILELGRWEKDKKFRLYGLLDYFREVKTNEQIEHLIIEDNIIDRGALNAADGGGQKPYVPKAPNTESNQVKNFTSGRASLIKAYRFSPMVSADDSRICTTPLHQFDFASNKFKVLFNDNKINDVHERMTSFIKANLYSFSQNSDAHLLLNINWIKNTGVMMHHHFESSQYCPSFLPQTNMLRDLLFLNECITFVVSGLTIRAPGRFIFIDKLSSSGDPDPHDDRFLGQWLILKVVHFFQQGKYVSEVTATKVDTFRKLWADDLK
jgi:hypothetical protein